MTDPYVMLGIERDASAEEIKRAWRAMAKTAHPDAGGSAEQFKALSRAYMILSNPKSRASYDRTGQVDGREIRSAEDTYRTQLMAAFEQTIVELGPAAGDADIMGNLRNALGAQRRDHARQRTEIDKRRAGYEKLKSRITREGEGENLFAQLLDHHIAQAAENLDRLDFAIQVLDLCTEELRHYSSVTEMVQAQMYWVNTSTFTNTTTTSTF